MLHSTESGTVETRAAVMGRMLSQLHKTRTSSKIEKVIKSKCSFKKMGDTKEMKQIQMCSDFLYKLPEPDSLRAITVK